jgi:HAD superfamily hydrolase (TIGR01509 family)
VIKAIIFDCFGVLATDGWLPFKEEHFGYDEGLYAQATDLNKQADAGLLDYAEYVHQIALLADVTDAEVASNLDSNVPNRKLFAYIQERLKPNYKIGLLSNSGGDWLDRIFSPDQVALFDATVLSYQLGVVKPDPRMYEAIAQRLGVALDECVFVDDQQRYCTAAAEVGMQTVYYQTFDQTKRNLEKLLQ